MDHQHRESGCPVDPMRIVLLLEVDPGACEDKADNGEQDAQVEEGGVGFYDNSFFWELINALDHAAILSK